MGIGDWGLGIGDWGLGIGPNPQIDELSTRPGRYQILYGSSSLDKDLQTLDFVVKP